MIQGGTRPQISVQGVVSRDIQCHASKSSLRLHVVRSQNAFRLHCCSSAAVTMGDHPPDVLLLDATNILSKAKADSSRWRGHRGGPSLKRCFQAWIDFLHTSTAGVPIIAVFDSPVSKLISLTRWDCVNQRHIINSMLSCNDCNRSAVRQSNA
jgi:hypothetical protein